VWLTIHGRYRPVGRVLTPLQLDRIRVERGAEAGRNEVLVRLRVAYNGEEPGPAAPDMGD
jgi:hypothetical protein